MKNFEVNSSRLIAFMVVGIIILFLHLQFVLNYLPLIKNDHSFEYYSMFVFITIGAIMVFWTHFVSVFSDPGYLIKDSFEASSLTNV